MWKNWLSVICLLSVFGCATKDVRVEPISLDKDPKTEVEALSAEVKKADENSVDALSPTWFERAQKSLKSAEETYNNGEDRIKLFDTLSHGFAEIREAERNAQIASVALEEPLAAWKKAKEAGANANTPGYTNAQGHFLSLAKGVENGKVETARESAPAVAKQFHEVELTAIKNGYIKEPQGVLDAAQKLDADDLFPKEFASVQSSIDALSKKVDEDPYNTKALNDESARVCFQAKRLQVLSMEVKRMKEDPARQALRLETLFSEIGQTAGSPDLRDRNFAEQASFNKNRLATIRAKNEALFTSNSELSEENEQLQSDTDVLSTMDEVKKFVPNDQAEVLTNGKKIIIRLSGLGFRTGSARLEANNEAVVENIAKAIDSVEPEFVTVEGHADATGNQRANKRLSEERADAILTYLKKHTDLDDEKLRAVGYGSEKPIASNQKASGREQNRRVDIVLDTQRTVAGR